MSAPIELRPYQARALERFEASKRRAVLIVAPTGAGKGPMAAELMARTTRRRQRALFLVHRTEIVSDIEKRLRARGVGCTRRLYSDHPVRVTSTQTALRAELQRVDLLLVDEAHHYAADEWRQVVERIPARRIVGFTATPERADGRPLGDMFEELIETVTYSELIRSRLLVPARVLRPTHELGSDMAQHPADAYARYGRGEGALIYVRRIAEAEEVRARLAALGIESEGIYGKTKTAVRASILERLQRGTLPVVVSVGTLTEGVDVPSVRVCVLARPCAHASTYVQIVGRILRPAPGKTEATLIDLVGASYVHGLPGEDVTYSLHGRAITPLETEPPERSDPADPEVLGLELVTIPARSPDAPRTRMRGRGFVYHDRAGFYSMRWNADDGRKARMGLATKDRDVAEATLTTFREQGEEAARAEVLQRKRQRLTLACNRESRRWHIIMWNAARTELVKVHLFTRDKREAERLKELYKDDRDAFDRERAALRADAEEQSNRERGEALRARHRARQSSL